MRKRNKTGDFTVLEQIKLNMKEKNKTIVSNEIIVLFIYNVRREKKVKITRISVSPDYPTNL